MEMFRKMWFLPLAVLLTLSLFACADDDDSDDDAGDDDDNDNDDNDNLSPDDDTADDDVDDDDDDNDDDYAPPPSNDIGVFVSLGTGGYGNPGTMEEPLLYIEDGLALAESEHKVVFVAAALYNEVFTAFVSLYGGYDPLTWTRDIAEFRTILSPHSPTADWHIVVTGGKSGDPVVVEGFEVRAEPDFNYEMYGEMALSVGIEIDGGHVVLSKNHIEGNAAADYAGYSGARSTAVQVTEAEFVRLCDNYLSGGFSEGLFGSETIGVTILGEGVRVEMQRNTVSSGLAGAVSPYVTGACLYGVYADMGAGPITLIQNDIRTPWHWEPTKLAEAFAVMSWSENDLLAVANFLLADNALDSRAVVACGPTQLIQNTIVSTGQLRTHAAVLYDQAILVDDILRSGNGSVAAVIRLEGSDFPLQIVHSDLDSASTTATLISGTGVQVDNLAELNACGWDGCEAAYGNLSVNPSFTSAGDLHLKAGSPCINAGIDPSPWCARPEIYLDIDGNPRPAGAGWEIGADERPTR